MMCQAVWIVGGSSGIGYELALLYLQNDYRVIVGSRSATKALALQELSLAYKKNITLLDIDVSSNESVEEATQKALQVYDGIEMCIYNAGIYESMKTDTWKIEHFEQMMQINYLGAVRVTNALKGYFEQKKQGSIIYNASISSYFGLPYGSGYSAPKAALLNFCESIQPEFQAKNIDIRVINHGFVKTRLTDKNEFEMPQLLEARDAAAIIYKKITDENHFEIRFPFLLTSFLYLLRILPYSIAFYFTRKTL